MQRPLYKDGVRMLHCLLLMLPLTTSFIGKSQPRWRQNPMEDISLRGTGISPRKRSLTADQYFTSLTRYRIW